MDVLVEKTIQNIINIPDDFNHQNKSQNTLLYESGYLEFHDQISEDKIALILKRNPEVIKKWLQFSEDKRSYGWYFTKGEDGKCFVGHYPEGKEFEEINTSDEFMACASYIKREVERTRIGLVLPNK
jgi:hypothetical protein